MIPHDELFTYYNLVACFQIVDWLKKWRERGDWLKNGGKGSRGGKGGGGFLWSISSVLHEPQGKGGIEFILEKLWY